MSATPAQKLLDAAAGRQKKIAESGIRRGSRVGSIDPVLFHSGIAQGKRLGVKEHNPWDNKDFCAEMSKEHPEIGDMGSGGGRGICQKTLENARKLVGG